MAGRQGVSSLRKSRKIRAPGPKKQPWSLGKQLRKTDRQFLYVPREHLELWFGVLLYCGGPVYAVAIWLCMVTSRRISETLRLRSGNLATQGGEHDDHPHVLYQVRSDEEELPGIFKLGSNAVAARLCTEAVHTIEMLTRQPLTWAPEQARAALLTTRPSHHRGLLRKYIKQLHRATLLGTPGVRRKDAKDTGNGFKEVHTSCDHRPLYEKTPDCLELQTPAK